MLLDIATNLHHKSTHHIINVVIRADLPFQGTIQLAHHKVAVTFILHELLETVQLEPTNALSFKHLIHNLVTTEIQESTSRETAAFFAQHI
jgi:hypothetical protein